MYPRQRVAELIEFAKTQPPEERRLVYEAMSYLVWLGRHLTDQPLRDPSRAADKRRQLEQLKADIEVIR